MFVYAHVSVWVCAHVHADGHFTAQTPKRCELIVFFYLCVFIYMIYPESTGFDNSQDGGQNSHGDYKNTVSGVECRIQ